MNSRGFTLIEIMVVLGIIVAVLAFGFQRIDNRNNQIKSAVRKFTALAKQMHSFAKLNNATYRIVFELGVNEKDPQTYWIEKANGPVIPSTADLTLSADELRESLEAAQKTEPSSSAEGFSMDTKIFKEKKQLPEGVRIISVELAQVEKPITQGRAYIYFLPQGMTSEAIVQLTAGPKLNWSLITEPLTGRLDVVTEHLTIKDLRQ